MEKKEKEYKPGQFTWISGKQYRIRKKTKGEPFTTCLICENYSGIGCRSALTGSRRDVCLWCCYHLPYYLYLEEVHYGKAKKA